MPEIKTLPISLIRTDGGTQTRAALNPETVKEYAEAYSRGEDLPPVTVVYDGTNYWLVDGFHRLQAFKDAAILADEAEMAGADAGFDEIAVDIRQGTLRDAILFSVAANATHGLRRSKEDRERAVTKLLLDDEWVTWSNREIARRTRTNHPLVAAVRQRLEESGEIEPVTERTYTRDGEIQTMATGNISSANADRAIDNLGEAKARILEHLQSGPIEPYGMHTALGVEFKTLVRARGQLLSEGKIRIVKLGTDEEQYVLASQYDHYANQDQIASSIIPEPDFAAVCDTLITALEAGPLTRDELRQAASVDDQDLFTRALKFQHSAERLAMRRDADGQVRYYLPAPRTGLHPHSIAAEETRIKQVQESRETARKNGTLTYNGTAYPADNDPADLRTLIMDTLREYGDDITLSHLNRLLGDHQVRDIHKALTDLVQDGVAQERNLRYALVEAESTPDTDDDPVVATVTGGALPPSNELVKEYIFDAFRAKRSLNRAFYPAEITRWINRPDVRMEQVKPVLEALAKNPHSGIRAVQTKTGLAYADHDTTIESAPDALDAMQGTLDGLRTVLNRLENIDSADFVRALVARHVYSLDARLQTAADLLELIETEFTRLTTAARHHERDALNDDVREAMTAAAAAVQETLSPAVQELYEAANNGTH